MFFSNRCRSGAIRLPGSISATYASFVPPVPSRLIYAPLHSSRAHGSTSTARRSWTAKPVTIGMPSLAWNSSYAVCFTSRS